jgi:hypothetical protein
VFNTAGRSALDGLGEDGLDGLTKVGRKALVKEICLQDQIGSGGGMEDLLVGPGGHLYAFPSPLRVPVLPVPP